MQQARLLRPRGLMYIEVAAFRQRGHARLRMKRIFFYSIQQELLILIRSSEFILDMPITI